MCQSLFPACSLSPDDTVASLASFINDIREIVFGEGQTHMARGRSMDPAIAINCVCHCAQPLRFSTILWSLKKTGRPVESEHTRPDPPRCL